MLHNDNSGRSVSPQNDSRIEYEHPKVIAFGQEKKAEVVTEISIMFVLLLFNEPESLKDVKVCYIVVNYNTVVNYSCNCCRKVMVAVTILQ